MAPSTIRTWYFVMAEPLLAGAVHRPIAEPTPAVEVPILGAPGLVAGITALERDESGPAPTALTAWTWNRTGTPPGSPVKLRLVAGAATSFEAMSFVPVAASTMRTWYRMIGEPPSAMGAVHTATASAVPEVAGMIAGAAGTVVAVPTADGIAAFAGEIPIMATDATTAITAALWRVMKDLFVTAPLSAPCARA